MESDNNKNPYLTQRSYDVFDGNVVRRIGMNQESSNQNKSFLEFLNTLNLFEYHEYLVNGYVDKGGEIVCQK